MVYYSVRVEFVTEIICFVNIFVGKVLVTASIDYFLRNFMF